MPDKKITILIDNESWILPYAEMLKQKLNALDYEVVICRNHSELSAGWINFMLGCTQILPCEKLTLHEHNLVVHESNLPLGKGFAPMTWQILEGKSLIPVCLIEANENVDSGKVWLRDEIVLDGNELHDEWRHKQGLTTIEMCKKFIEKYDSLDPEEQKGVSTFYKRRTPQDSELDINKNILESFNLLRVVDNENYPAFFRINGKKYKLKIERV